MKKLYLATMLCALSAGVYAQEYRKTPKPPIEDAKDESEVYRIVEVVPRAPYDWSAYLAANLRYPEAARKQNLQGKMYVTFIVEKDGSISTASVVRGKELGSGLPEEAVRLVKSMPKWKPGLQNGQPVRVYFTLPVTFKLAK